MAYLYIANTTKQNHVFAFRIPDPNGAAESKDIKYEHIPVGQQIRLGEDFNPEQIAAIVKQHEPYGLTHVKDIDRRREFVGLCYSIDKPVSMDAMIERVGDNDTALNKRAAERHEEVAASVASGLESTGAPLARAEMEVVEDTEGTPKVATGVEVVNTGKPRHDSKPGPRAAQQGK